MIFRGKRAVQRGGNPGKACPVPVPQRLDTFQQQNTSREAWSYPSDNFRSLSPQRLHGWYNTTSESNPRRRSRVSMVCTFRLQPRPRTAGNLAAHQKGTGKDAADLLSELLNAAPLKLPFIRKKQPSNPKLDDCMPPTYKPSPSKLDRSPKTLVARTQRAPPRHRAFSWYKKCLWLRSS